VKLNSSTLLAKINSSTLIQYSYQIEKMNHLRCQTANANILFRSANLQLLELQKMSEEYLADRCVHV
jgi:hypothetical protein